jgi:hypothetical protein
LAPQRALFLHGDVEASSPVFMSSSQVRATYPGSDKGEAANDIGIWLRGCRPETHRPCSGWCGGRSDHCSVQGSLAARVVAELQCFHGLNFGGFGYLRTSHEGTVRTNRPQAGRWLAMIVEGLPPYVGWDASTVHKVRSG